MKRLGNGHRALYRELENGSLDNKFYDIRHITVRSYVFDRLFKRLLYMEVWHITLSEDLR